MQKIALPFVACLLAVAAIGAHAQSVWKWRDAAGQLHISDTAPPPGTPAGNILASPVGGMAPAVATTTATGAAAPESDLDKKKKAADRDKADKADKDKADKAALAQKNAAMRQDNCARANNEIKDLQAGNRVAVLNAKGERQILDDAGRAAEIKRTQDVAAASCGAAPAQQ